jgi:xanthine dehydrogenase accessory factor
VSSTFNLLGRAENDGKICALCTIVESHGSTPRHIGSKMIVYPDGKISGSVGGGEIEKRVIDVAKQCLDDKKPQLLQYNLVNPEHGDPGVCGGSVQVFVEPVLPRPQLVVIGGGHVGKAVVHLAAWLGFKVIVSDDRPEFCSPEFHPEAEEFIVAPMAEIPAKINVHENTFIVLTTRGAGIDIPGLPSLLDTQAAYIGVIGSRRRWILTKKGMAEAGVSAEKIERVKSPIGIDIKAETPEELAVSIMAEIILERNKAISHK